MRTIYVLAAFFLLLSPIYAQQYDLVIQGGRVIDPETGLDAVRNVGISNGKIARIVNVHDLIGHMRMPLVNRVRQERRNQRGAQRRDRGEPIDANLSGFATGT